MDGDLPINLFWVQEGGKPIQALILIVPTEQSRDKHLHKVLEYTASPCTVNLYILW
jgi:hypothetical protein